MPRFFIDRFDGTFWLYDQEGQNFRDPREAECEALRALGEMAREKLAGRRMDNLVADVRDETKQTIYTAKLSLTAYLIG